MRRRRRYAWAFLALAGMLLGVYHNHRVQYGEANLITALIRGLLTPLQRTAQSTTENAGQLLATLTHAREALREYDHLALENARLKHELEQMRAVAAEIDRGSRDGVMAGAPVVAGEGLVGVVERADATTSIVRMLVAPRMAVSVRVLNAQKASTGVCEGRGESMLLLNFIPPEAPLQAGDRIVTAGLGGKYPPNLTIGVVEQVWLDRQYSVKKAWVRPAVDFERLSVALVKRGR